MKIELNKTKPNGSRQEWFEGLDDEDLAFIKRFVLLSGSLKDLAQTYGVSYPTLRLRLDRIIEKIKVLESHRIESAYERVLRTQYAAGNLDAATFKYLLETYLSEPKGSS